MRKINKIVFIILIIMIYFNSIVYTSVYSNYVINSDNDLNKNEKIVSFINIGTLLFFAKRIQIVLLITIIILILMKLKKIRKIKKNEQSEEKNELKKVVILILKAIVVFNLYFILHIIINLGGPVYITEKDRILQPYFQDFRTSVIFECFICLISFLMYIINLINFMIREHCNKKIKIILGTFKTLLFSGILMIILEFRRKIILVDFLHNTVPTINGITLNDVRFVADNSYFISILEISNITFIIFVFIWYYFLKKRIARIENK